MPKENNIKYTETAIQHSQTPLSTRVNYELKHNYPNPFKTNIVKPIKNEIKKASLKETSTDRMKKEFKIDLNAIVINNHQKTAHVSVNNKYYIVTIGDTIPEGIIVGDIKLDSIKLKLEGKTSWIKRK